MVWLIFQSTLPMRGATAFRLADNKVAEFQSTLPMRGATQASFEDLMWFVFQSTLPMRGATNRPCCIAPCLNYFNPRSPCGERRKDASRKQGVGDFNPRSPCGERRLLDVVKTKLNDFNPRSPCGERQKELYVLYDDFDFNPRSPCGERRRFHRLFSFLHLFQSTLPMRGATVKQKTLNPCGIQHIILRTS